MPLKRITHENKDLQLLAVLREKTGADALDASTVHRVIAEHIAKQLKKDVSKIPPRFWGRIIFVADVMQQTVQLEGDGRFDIPDIDATAEDIADFYDFMMTLSEKHIDFFRDGLRKFDAAPLATGGPEDPASKSESTENPSLNQTEQKKLPTVA